MTSDSCRGASGGTSGTNGRGGPGAGDLTGLEARGLGWVSTGASWDGRGAMARRKGGDTDSGAGRAAGPDLTTATCHRNGSGCGDNRRCWYSMAVPIITMPWKSSEASQAITYVQFPPSIPRPRRKSLIDALRTEVGEMPASPQPSSQHQFRSASTRMASLNLAHGKKRQRPGREEPRQVLMAA